MQRHICIHGHFYQPPRENPWLETIEMQESAYPYHNWNERITYECYSSNTASRILDSKKDIVEIINNYQNISFNFGATLLSWLQAYSPQVYEKILLADQESQKAFSGHGSALAQAYNHMIMPLANSRDKQTQIIWGIADFESRFQRKPEGMWLPETAVDIETLEVLVEHGILFTILTPYQAKRVRKINDTTWFSVDSGRIDTQFSYRCPLPSGKSIIIFFYNGPISRDMAFGDLLKSGEDFAKSLVATFPSSDDLPRLAHVATDGETYGHHHRYGEMALSYCLHYIRKYNLARITNYAEFLANNPPRHEVEIIEKSSWSCFHGVERWCSDCGCHIGGHPGWQQKWRKPLRDALDWLRDKSVPFFEEAAKAYVTNPWDLRNKYISVINDRSEVNVRKFLEQHVNRQLSGDEQSRLLKLLEMQRNAMLMYTSCGWFFDEISGIETVQIMCYAARVAQLIKELGGEDCEENFVKMLEKAPSNIIEYQNGAKVYELMVKPAVTNLLRVGANYAVSSLFEDFKKTAELYCYTITRSNLKRWELGNHTLVLGEAVIKNNITWEESTIYFAALHLGDHNVLAGVDEVKDSRQVESAHDAIHDAFKKNEILETTRAIEKHFPNGRYTLTHLFKDQQSKILYKVLASTLEEIEASLRQINEYHYPIIRVIKQLHIPIPKVLANTILVMLNKDILEEIENDYPQYIRLQELVNEVKDWSLSMEIDKVTISFVVRRKINGWIEQLVRKPEDIQALQAMEALLRIFEPLTLNIDLWSAQNMYFSIGKQQYSSMKAKAFSKDKQAEEWLKYFDLVGYHLKVSIV